MRIDRLGCTHSTESEQALIALDGAVEGLLKHGAETKSLLDAALAHDAELPAAVALKGFLALTLARGELVPLARDAADHLRRILAERGATPREHALAEALTDWSGGRMRRAAERLEALVEREPSDLMAFKLAQTGRFMLGDLQGMIRFSAAVTARRPLDAEGQGYVFGCYAFGLEEIGGFAAAETAGRIGLEHAPRDAWGLHAVAHVYEMTGRPAAGIAWIEENRAAWTHCNNFAFHVAWHLALFHLERGGAATALALYDAAVRPSPTDDFRDIANAASLLWRLEQHGAEVGELGAVAARRAGDTTLVFASLHYLLSLLGCGRRREAEELTDALRSLAESDAGDQAQVARDVGLPLALALIESRAGVRAQAVQRIAAKLRALQALGGSNAQRDVFVRTLAAAAKAADDVRSMRAVLTERGRLKAPDRFLETLEDGPTGSGSEEKTPPAAEFFS